jgi:hypothetical protein
MEKSCCTFHTREIWHYIFRHDSPDKPEDIGNNEFSTQTQPFSMLKNKSGKSHLGFLFGETEEC